MARINAVTRLDAGDSINRGLEAWFPFDENAGLDAFDISANRYHAVNESTGFLLNRAGPIGRFRDWSTVDTRLKEPAFRWRSGVPISVSCWVNCSAARGNTLFSITGGGRDIKCFGPYSDGNIYWDGGDEASGRISTSFASYADKWTHLALVNDNVGFKAIYINGNLITSSTAALTSMTGGTTLRFGQWTDGGYMWLGQLANFRLASRVYTGTEIRRLYHEPWAGSVSGRTRRVYDVASGGPITGSSSVTLTALTSTGTGNLAITGTGARTLAAVTSTGTGTLAIGGTAARTLAALTSTGSGTLTIEGAAGVTLGALTSTGTGELPIEGTAAATLEDLTSASVEPPATTSVHGRMRRYRRTIIWDDPPPELAPVVALAENYAEDLAVERAVDAAIAKLDRLSARATMLRRARVLEEVRVSIVEAVARAAEQDDEEALIALL